MSFLIEVSNIIERKLILDQLLSEESSKFITIAKLYKEENPLCTFKKIKEDFFNFIKGNEHFVLRAFCNSFNVINRLVKEAELESEEIAGKMISTMYFIKNKADTTYNRKLNYINEKTTSFEWSFPKEDVFNLLKEINLRTDTSLYVNEKINLSYEKIVTLFKVAVMSYIDVVKEYKIDMDIKKISIQSYLYSISHLNEKDRKSNLLSKIKEFKTLFEVFNYTNFNEEYILANLLSVEEDIKTHHEEKFLIKEGIDFTDIHYTTPVYLLNKINETIEQIEAQSHSIIFDKNYYLNLVKEKSNNIDRLWQTDTKECFYKEIGLLINLNSILKNILKNNDYKSYINTMLNKFDELFFTEELMAFINLKYEKEKICL